jgi:hypothetical protein
MLVAVHFGILRPRVTGGGGTAAAWSCSPIESLPAVAAFVMRPRDFGLHGTEESSVLVIVEYVNCG